MHNVLIIFFLSFSFGILAQPGEVEMKTIDGGQFYLHPVQSGNTLWGLSRMYAIPADAIVEANPSLTEGLKEGQIIVIPVTKSSLATPELKFQDYKVKRQETLYGISRKFDVTEDQLIAWNPEVQNGLQAGQIIKVPASETEIVEIDTNERVQEIETIPNPFATEDIDLGNGTTIDLTFSDSVVEHLVLAHETMYTISNRFMVSMNEIMELNGLTSTNLKEGQILRIPVKKEEFSNLEVRPVPILVDDSLKPIIFDKKKHYNIVVMLPFYVGGGPSTEYVASISTQLYMGALLAVDSLEAMGLNATLYVLDTKNDSATVQKLLNGSEVKSADLIIGPLFEKPMAQVAKYCKANGVRMICPVSSGNKILKGNPYVYSSVSSDLTLYSGLGNYLANHSDYDRVVLIEPSDEVGKQSLNYIRSAFQENKKEGVGPVLINAGLDNFSSYVRKGEKVAFVYPTENKTKAVNFMSKVNMKAFKTKDGEVSVYGSKEWVAIEDMNNFYKNKYSFHYSSPNYLDYHREDVIAMNQLYRSKYKTDMSKISIQGYDLMLYYCSLFFLDKSDCHLLMNDFSPQQISEGSGYDNNIAFIVEQEEYELIERGKIER